jgi:hypothetical protein
VIYAGLEVVFYGMAAAASAVGLSATLVAIRSMRPRTNAIAFLSGFVLGTLIACGLGLAVGQTASERLDSLGTLKALVALVLGLVLIVVGLRARHAPAAPSPSAPTERTNRATGILGGLHNVGPAATFSMAGLLGFGGPKRLVLTFLAMAAATEAGLRDLVDISLVAVYLVVSSLLVLVPVGIVVLAGDRADATFARGQSWLAEHAVALRVWLALGIGAALVVDGLLRLLL